jgi:hypothetical protein
MVLVASPATRDRSYRGCSSNAKGTQIASISTIGITMMLRPAGP